MGRSMLFIAWILFLGMLTYYFQIKQEADYNPNQNPDSNTDSKGVREVILQRNKYSHYVSSGKINHVPVTFLIDTGATSVSIPSIIAKKIGLTPGYSYDVMTANGTVTVQSSQLDSLEIGEIILYNVRANINPGMKEEGILLGMSVLKHLEIIQRGHSLTLRQFP